MREVNQDVTRLPKWAQEKIAGLEREVKEKAKHIDEISLDHADSNTMLDQHYVYPDVGLPGFSHVLFYLGEDRNRWENTLEVGIRRSRPDTIEISSTNRRITIRPTSYGRIEIGLSDA